MSQAALKISDDLFLPPEAVTQTFAILAKRGVGKTYTASVMAEEMLKAQLRLVVIDPIGVWWGLRVNADGLSPGLPIIIIGGDKGDVPLDSTNGQLIADLVVDEGISAVLDLGNFSGAEQTRFMTDFAERLYLRNRDPLHLILDEADAFAPQSPMPDERRMLGAIEKLVRRGRARGIGVTMISQRPAVLNKNVLTQIEVLITLRLTGPQDRKAIDDWVNNHGSEVERKQLMDTLPHMPIGVAWFWSPGWLEVFKQVSIRQRETFDSSITPKVGEKVITPKTLADVNIDQLKEKLATNIEKVKNEDPKALRQRIAALEKQLATQPSQPPKEIRVEIPVEVPVLTEGDLARIEGMIEDLHDLANLLIRQAVDLEKALSSVTPKAEKVNLKPPVAEMGPITVTGLNPADLDTFKLARKPALPQPAEGLALRAGERKMLETMGEYLLEKYTRVQLGTLSGFAASGGTFGAYYANLKRNGLIYEEGGFTTLTGVGINFIGNPTYIPRSQKQIFDRWASCFRAGEVSMLEVLVKAYPASITREELGKQSGYAATGGTFGAYLGSLRRNGLLEVNGDQVKATSILFPPTK